MKKYIEFNIRRDFDRELFYEMNKLSFMFLRRIKSVIINDNFVNKTSISVFSKTKKSKQKSTCELQETLKNFQKNFTKN